MLAHRATQGSQAITKEMFKGSSISVDIKTIVMGDIGIHQANAYRATMIAVLLARKEKWSLSFAGHSLGSFLAELSVFYCHTDFKFKNVKAVTFDGPGSRQMMERLSTGLIEGGGVAWVDIK